MSITDLMSDPTKITARKFQMGKQAKKKAEELQIRNAYLKSIEGNGQAAQQTIVDNRPSLMEEHLSKKARVEEPGSRVRRAFDREKVRVHVFNKIIHLFCLLFPMFTGCCWSEKAGNARSSAIG